VLQRGTALSVTFTASDADTACQDWIRTRGKQGEFWSLVGQPTEQQSVACIFTSGSGAQAEIDDGGGQLLAQNFCAAFAGTQGWIEDTQAEQAVVTKAKQAQQRAAATQQAKQTIISDASAVTYDLQAVQDAASALGGDSLGEDISGLKDDLSAIHGDLQTVQSDSSDVVCGDASVVSGDESSMEGDRSSMEGDIGVFQGDIQTALDGIATLKSDQAKYLADITTTRYHSTDVPSQARIDAGISNAGTAVAKERAAFASARAQAAQLISHAKGYVAHADAICKRAGG
jgi:hypothetical protein